VEQARQLGAEVTSSTSFRRRHAAHPEGRALEANNHPHSSMAAKIPEVQLGRAGTGQLELGDLDRCACR
jgi:hypothetical protein